jgi:trigger factor
LRRKLEMSVVLEKKENNKVSFNIEVEFDKFEANLQKAYLKNRGKFSLPGFRKGKVPRKILEMNYGEDLFYEDAINLILPEEYDLAITELGLEPVDTPEVDVDEIEKDKPVMIKFQVDVKPEIKLGDYKNIELEKVEYNVTDEIIDNELKRVQDTNGRLVDAADREVQDGDHLKIDFEGSVDGVLFPGGSAEGQNLEIGSNTFIPGFEEQLIGKKIGEEVEVKVTFPEDYQEESLMGKEASFKVTIHEIKEKELPELDDEFAKDVSEFDTLEEYKASIKENLEENFKRREKIELENRVIDEVVSMSELDVPEAIINSQLETEVGEFDHQLRSQGIELEQYLSMTGSTMEEIKEQLRPMALKRATADLVLEAIAKEENIEVTEEDIDNELNRIAKQYNEEDGKKFIQDMKKRDLSFLNAGIANGKVIEMLVSNVKFKKEEE